MLPPAKTDMGTAYYEITQPLNGIYRISDPMGSISTLVVGQEAALLLDTGFGLGNIRSAVKEITALPLTVVCSHEHVDHIGGCCQFEKVWIHEKALQSLQRKDICEIRSRILKAAEKQQQIQKGFFIEKPFMDYQFQNAEILPDEKIFYLGGKTVSVVPLPSHTASSIGLLCRENRILLTGDSIAPMTSLVFPDSMSPEEYAGLLKQVEQYEFDHMLCSHSANLLPKRILQTYRECAENWETLDSYKYREQFYPEIKGRIYFYKGEAALIIKTKIN